MSWLAALDMDGTILERRTIDVLCEALGLTSKLAEIGREAKYLKGYEVSERIARLFAGIKASKMEEIFDEIRIVNGVGEFVDFLRSKGFVTTIITDSYTFLAVRVARKLGIDDVEGNMLEILNGIITGKIHMPLGWQFNDVENCEQKAICKLRVMRELMRKYEVIPERTLAIGDSKSDCCMLRSAAIAIAFRPKDDVIRRAGDVVVSTDFCELKRWLKDFLDTTGTSLTAKNVFWRK